MKGKKDGGKEGARDEREETKGRVGNTLGWAKDLGIAPLSMHVTGFCGRDCILLAGRFGQVGDTQEGWVRSGVIPVPTLAREPSLQDPVSLAAFLVPRSRF